MTGKKTEIPVNTYLCNVLWTKNTRWRDCMESENVGVIEGNPSLQPDILVCHPGGLPVVIETEFGKGPKVKQEAEDRLRLKLSSKCGRHSGKRIEQAIALRIPGDLREEKQKNIERKLEEARYEYCVFSVPKADEDDGVSSRRWPKDGWIECGIDELASAIEHTALSENQIDETMKILDEGIVNASVKLQDWCAECAPDALRDIALSLHQIPEKKDDGEDGNDKKRKKQSRQQSEQTTKMAMAIVANALTFHATIAGKDGVKPLSKLNGAGGKPSRRKVLEAWDYIVNEINYYPIFSIASEILAHVPDGVAQDVLESLVDVAEDIVNNLGATSQHDFSGRLFQKLIEDRKFLATFYTLPTSAILLAELAISRMGTDWTDKRAVTGLRVADFACGTGALLNAAYGSMMARYRRGGGGRLEDPSQDDGEGPRRLRRYARRNPSHDFGSFKRPSAEEISEHEHNHDEIRRGCGSQRQHGHLHRRIGSVRRAGGDILDPADSSGTPSGIGKGEEDNRPAARLGRSGHNEPALHKGHKPWCPEQHPNQSSIRGSWQQQDGSTADVRQAQED